MWEPPRGRLAPQGTCPPVPSARPLLHSQLSPRHAWGQGSCPGSPGWSVFSFLRNTRPHEDVRPPVNKELFLPPHCFLSLRPAPRPRATPVLPPPSTPAPGSRGPARSPQTLPCQGPTVQPPHSPGESVSGSQGLSQGLSAEGGPAAGKGPRRHQSQAWEPHGRGGHLSLPSPRHLAVSTHPGLFRRKPSNSAAPVSGEIETGATLP